MNVLFPCILKVGEYFVISLSDTAYSFLADETQRYLQI